MKNTEEFKSRFLTDTDDTGRFTVTSARTGRTDFVEPIGSDRPADWGSVNPGEKDLMVKNGRRTAAPSTPRIPCSPERTGSARLSRLAQAKAR